LEGHRRGDRRRIVDPYRGCAAWAVETGEAPRRKAAKLFGLSEAEERMLNEAPYRGTTMPPTAPLIYRFYEMVMVNDPPGRP
jgi:cyanate lyase